MGKQHRQGWKPWRGRENGFKSSLESTGMSYETSLTWMDETGLFYGYTPMLCFSIPQLTSECSMAPDRGLSDQKQSGVKGKKVRLTYAFTSNADGSERLRPFVIGKAARP